MLMLGHFNQSELYYLKSFYTGVFCVAQIDMGKKYSNINKVSIDQEMLFAQP